MDQYRETSKASFWIISITDIWRRFIIYTFRTLLEQQKAKITVSNLPLFVSISLFFQASFDNAQPLVMIKILVIIIFIPLIPSRSAFCTSGFLPLLWINHHLTTAMSLCRQWTISGGFLPPSIDHRNFFQGPRAQLSKADIVAAPMCFCHFAAFFCPWLISSQLLCIFVVLPPFSSVVSCPR